MNGYSTCRSVWLTILEAENMRHIQTTHWLRCEFIFGIKSAILISIQFSEPYKFVYFHKCSIHRVTIETGFMISSQNIKQSRIISEKLIVVQRVEKYPDFYGNQSLLQLRHVPRPWILCTSSPSFFKIHYNIILTSSPRSSSGLFPSSLQVKTLCQFPISMRAACPTQRIFLKLSAYRPSYSVKDTNGEHPPSLRKLYILLSRCA
jgi:hypothetical protein